MANLNDYCSYISSTRYDPSRSLTTATLWKHQTASLEFILSRDKAIGYIGMGAGKTLISLVYMEHFDGLRLVLCPKRALPVWKADHDAFYLDGKPFELVILDSGTTKQKEKILDALKARKAKAVVVVNYESAALLPLHKYGFTAAVADEAHRLGAYRSKQSRVLAKSCAAIPYKVAMTGSPIHDGLERIYGIARWLDSVILHRGYPQSKLFGSYDDFLNSYTTTYQLGMAKIIKGYKNQQALADKIKDFTLLIKTSEVIDLPEAVFRRYDVELSPETREAYESLKDDAIIEFDDGAVLAPHVLTRLLRLQQLISCGVLDDEDGQRREFDVSSRLEALEGILEGLTDVPVVIVCRFVRDVEIITRLIKEKFNEDCHYLTGGFDNHVEWAEGAGRILISSVSAGSEGVRLARAAHMIRYSRSYSLKMADQGEARIRRHGQASPTVWYYDLVAEDTVDEAIYQALRRKSGDVVTVDKEIA